MLNEIKFGIRKFLGVSEQGAIGNQVKGVFDFITSTLWGRFEKVKRGDYSSMVDSYEGWVYGCVQVLAHNVAKVPFYVYKKRGKELELVEEHPFYALIENVGDHLISWEMEFLRQAYLDLTGGSYIYHPKNLFNRPAELRILESHLVTVFIKNGKIGYKYNNGGKIISFSSEEILHFKYPNPADIYRGMGPLEASRMGVNLNEYMGQFQLSLLGNRARPDGILKTEQSINDNEADRIKLKWKEKYQGVDKAGEVAVLGKGLDFSPITMAPRDLEYIKSKEMTKEEICAIFGVPPYKLGKVEKVNRANAYELEHSFQKDTISPRLVLRDRYYTKLVQEYDPSLVIQSENVVPRDRIFDLSEEKLYLGTGVVTINEVREKKGMEPKDYGDTPYLPMNLMPIGSGSIYEEEEDKGKLFIASIEDKFDRDRYWKGYVRRTEGEERIMRMKLGEFFNDQEKLVMKNLKKYGVPKNFEIDVKDPLIDMILFSLVDWGEKLFKILINLEEASVIKGAETLIEDFDLGINFNLISSRVQEFFRIREKLIKGINQYTFDVLRKSLTEGINGGETIKDLAGRIGKVFHAARGPRSVLIARTETNTCNNFGHLEAMRQANIERKEWITAGDGVPPTRELHMMNEDDGCRGLEEVFSGTGESYPGEYNCRCVVIPCMKK